MSVFQRSTGLTASAPWAVHGILAAIVCLAYPFSRVNAQPPGREDSEEIVFVHKLYFHGISYSDAHELGPAAVPQLLLLLRDRSEAPYWVNTIVTIGFIGDTTAVDPLLTFFAEQRDEVDGHTCRALLSVPFALGCLAFGGSESAFTYLTKRASPADWEDLQWRFGTEDLPAVMVEQAIIGLGVSGRSAARAVLAETPRTFGALSPEVRARLADLIGEALRANERISEEGPEQYFDGTDGGR